MINTVDTVNVAAILERPKPTITIIFSKYTG